MNKIDIHKDYIYNPKVINDITLIHISDMHFNSKTKEKKLNKIKNQIVKENPDYIIITGDTIDKPLETKHDNIKLLINFLKDLSKKHKIFMSIGNHDVYTQEDYLFFNNLKIDNLYILNNASYKDDYVYISGFTLPTNYYYNLEGEESEAVLLEHLKNNKILINNLPTDIPKIGLIHSPIKLTETKVIDLLKEYDLLLSGHTHGGLVPKLLNKIFKPNQGIISPRNKLFPKVARGKIEINKNNKTITIIINSGITKLGEKSAHLLSKLNFVFNIDINKIIITNQKGRNYE